MNPSTLPIGRAARRRLGLTLIEAALVLGVVALVFGGLSLLLGEASENNRSRNTADRLREVVKASESYVTARLADLRRQPVGSYRAIPITGASGDAAFPSLRDAGYLPSTFQDFNSYNQRHALIVRVLPPVTGGSTNRVEAMVTTVPNVVNALIPNRQRGRVAAMLGAQGGWCQGATPGQDACAVVTGVGGGWRTTPGEWASSGIAPARGTVQAMLHAGDSAVLSEYLNRNDIGDKAANTMNTTIHSSVPSGQFAMQADPANPGASTVLKFGPSVQVGDCTGTGATNGDLVACNNVRAQALIDLNDPNYRVDPNGRSEMQDVHSRKMDITDTVVYTTEGGDRLQGNENVRLRDLLPRYVAQDGWVASSEGNQTLVEVPQCAAGGTPRIFLAPMQDSSSYDLNQAIKYRTENDYLVALNGSNGSASRAALVDVNCNAGGCTSSSEGFLSDSLVGTRQGVTNMNVGRFNLYRQYAADAPPSLTAGQHWRVRMEGSEAAVQQNGQPVPWKVLATTFCYY